MKNRITPTELLRILEGEVANSEGEEKKMREAQLAGAKAMNTIWVRYRSGWAKQNADRIRKYNREYAKKRRGTNEVVDYLSLSVVERKIMEDVDNVK